MGDTFAVIFLNNKKTNYSKADVFEDETLTFLAPAAGVLLEAFSVPKWIQIGNFHKIHWWGHFR